MNSKITVLSKAMIKDILQTIADIEGAGIRKRTPYTADVPTLLLAPKTYKQYMEESKSAQYFIDKYNKKY